MFGKRLKYLRESKEMTQQELADQLGISVGTIGMYEIDKRLPNNKNRDKIAAFFNVSSSYLFGDSDDPTPVRDVNQDLYDEHNYAEELEALRNDEEFRLEFQDFDKWTDEEKRNILFAIRANRALREKNQKK